MTNVKDFQTRKFIFISSPTLAQFATKSLPQYVDFVSLRFNENSFLSSRQGSTRPTSEEENFSSFTIPRPCEAQLVY